MIKKLFRDIEPGECKDDYLGHIKSICRIYKGRRQYGHGRNHFAVLVWNTYHPEDPIVKGDGYHVHHKDENPMNDDKSNIIKKLQGPHLSDHAKNRSKETINKMSKAKKGNKIWLGKHHTPGAIKKISEAHKGKNQSEEHIRKRSESRFKPVLANNLKFLSGKEAAKALGVDSSTITRRIKAHKPGYQYL